MHATTSKRVKVEARVEEKACLVEINHDWWKKEGMNVLLYST